MSHVFLLVSTGAGAGLTTITLGMVRALDQLGIRTGFCKPVAQLHDGDPGPERSTQLIKKMTAITPPDPIALSRVKAMLGAGQEELLMEQVIQLYHMSAEGSDVVIVEGLVADGHAGYATRLNTAIAHALDAEVLLVSKPEEDLERSIDIAAHLFGDANGTALIGVIVNKIGVPEADPSSLDGASHTLSPTQSDDAVNMVRQRLANSSFHLVAAIPWQANLLAPRTCDIADYLHAEILHAGEMGSRRVEHVALCARTLANTLSVYRPHTLLIFPGDRDDVFVTACMAALNGVALAGILLTGGLQPSQTVMELCAQAFKTGLPLLLVPHDSFYTAAKVSGRPTEVAVDDLDLIDKGTNHIVSCLDSGWLKRRCAIERHARLSPAAFRYQLIQQASQLQRTIVLPEGDEARTIMAAHHCQQRRVAHCVLLGNPEQIHQAAASQGVVLDGGVTIIDPESVRNRYIEPMVKLRQHRGMTSQIAEDQLQ
ncbi:MAG: phosphate acyltransferase, partial [Mariprofundales bacterium]|nr:phosphate acyltransferase [Mariprofundales bacterium]